MPKKVNQPINVRQIENGVTKTGRVVSMWEVRCLYCKRTRNIKRANHARYFANRMCKHCSNKDSHPQISFKGIRVSFARKYELQAKLRNKSWNISLSDLADLAEKQDKKCALSGIDLVFDGDFNKINASLDRIDSTKGYEIDNIQWVHKKINMMKGQS